MMTRKDFQLVAAVLADAVGRADDDETGSPEQFAVVEEIARGLAEVFAADNPRFDQARFLAACGCAA